MRQDEMFRTADCLEEWNRSQIRREEDIPQRNGPPHLRYGGLAVIQADAGKVRRDSGRREFLGDVPAFQGALPDRKPFLHLRPGAMPAFHFRQGLPRFIRAAAHPQVLHIAEVNGLCQ